ncbi:MAG: aldo/keto reductase [Phenylobacterium sp.]|uniref:aldo/keto reductase n=1 Tax=Phenylobacterium sp. TaxID=1871053 RepID=UPI002716995E|nr:aldo/keto reductase [Phenylobacterium sp.]MDO9431240.1 aldo/keto reductase [Phenylobacterium sp.]
MTKQLRVELGDGHAIPQVGLGVWQTPDDVAVTAVQAALDAGYRHVDTAAAYQNEKGVGAGLRASGVARDEVFITTKVWNENQGYDNALKAIEGSLKRLQLDQLDLCLIHWPAPHRGLYLDTWRALIKAQEAGQVRSIGVSNFEVEHLDRVIGETGVTPVLNQIELHPRFQQTALRAAHAERGIKTESWSPLGQGQLLTDPIITGIAAKHGRTTAQVIIRWHLDSGLIVIPKSVTPSRIVENFDVFGFALDAEDMAAIAGLDQTDGRIGPNPMTATF